MRLRWKILGIGIGTLAAALIVQALLYRRYKSACESIEPGIPLAKAAEILEGLGAKHVAVIDREHQYLRVRVSLKHQMCLVKVDDKEKVIATRYEDSWDLL